MTLFPILVTAMVSILICGLGAFVSLIIPKRAAQKAENGFADGSLPGFDCMVCGFVSCEDYAKARRNPRYSGPLCPSSVVSDHLSKGKSVTAERISHEFCYFVACNADRLERGRTHVYDGLRECNAVYSLFAGESACKSGCLGYGTCVSACPTGAITISPKGLASIDTNACVECGRCREICPTGVIHRIPSAVEALVLCNNREKPETKKAICPGACIACGACEISSLGALRIRENLAEPAGTSLTFSEEVKNSCPKKIIVAHRNR